MVQMGPSPSPDLSPIDSLTTHLISVLRKDKDVQVEEHVSVVQCDKCIKL